MRGSTEPGGRAAPLAMRVLVRLAEAQGADRFIEVDSAHIDRQRRSAWRRALD